VTRRTIWEDLLGDTSERAHIAASDLVFPAGEAPRIALIRAGLVRVFIRTESGRQSTIRYARPGDLIGLAAVLGGGPTWNAEAIVDATLDVLTLEQIHAAAARHPELPWLVAEQLATLASNVTQTLADSSSQPMVARVARHLGELALRTSDGRAVAYVSHQRLADAVGTAREVVSRQLGRLRAAGVIDTQPGRVTVLDEERLEAIARSELPLQ
jgi:CRP/FNR family transcriptional regulator